MKKERKREAKRRTMRPDEPDTKTKEITTAQWSDAIKILTTRITDSTELSANDVKKLRALLVGAHANGMSQGEAVMAIERLGWRIRI